MALSALLLAGCSGSEQSSTVASEPGKVTELKSVDTLRAAFDAADGKVTPASAAVADRKRLSERRP